MQTNSTRSSNHLRACPAGATVGFTLMAVVAAGVAGVAQGQSAVGWGSNADGQLNQPASPGQLRDISLGMRHVSALRTDGTVVCWGHNGYNQVGGLPTDLNSVVALHAGDNHTIALRADGTVVCWGDNIYQQSTVPAGLAPAVGVSAGEAMSGVLHADGTVTLWGWDRPDGRLNVPAGLGAVTKLELGMTFGTVLRADGTVQYWGDFAPRVDASAVLRDIAAGYGHAVGLRPDGTVQAWGANGSGQATVPAGLSGVAAVAAGRLHSLALKQDGSVVCWGSNARGQAPNPSPVTANGQQVAAGEDFSYGLTLAGGIAAPSITLVSAIDPTCGLANGAIDTTVANADCVFWTGPSGFFLNGADLSGLSAGAYTVTAVGKGGSVSQTVTLTAESDTTAPVVSSYDAAESAAAGLACTALVPDFTASVVASDNCTATGALVVAQSPAAGTALGLGAHDITITVTDGSDNVATVTAVFTVTGTAVTYFVDADGDSFGAGTGVVYCNTTTPPGYATNNADCDDMRLLYADGDGDNFGAGAPVACGVALNTDCNDANNQVYPGRTEVCNGVDDNCAGGIDDGLVFNTYYVDSDNDGFGLRGSTGTSSCDRIAGAATNDADCNDGNAAINPKATEFCDAGNVDEDCDNAADNADASASEATKSDFYLDADADTYGAGAAVRFCDLPAGHSVNSADCNDAVAAINPAAAEICDAANTDENCNGTADNGDSGALDAGKTNFYADADADTYTGSVVGRFCDLPASGWEPTSEGDCNDANATVYPGAAELCANDGIDNDCDGEANSDLESGDATPYYLDTDRDGFGAGTAVRSCTAIAGRVANNLDCDDTKLLYRDNDGDGFGAGAPVACGVTTNTDCNDASNAVYPGALENCANDGTDNDCDGEANSDAEAIDSVSYYVDGDQDGFGAGAATKSCTSIAGSVTNNADCDDTKLLYADNDGDTYGAGNPVACGVASNTDCNDASNAVYPGAVENCANDGTDNDCDGEANSDAEAVDSVSYFVDGDQDGFGAGAETKSCTAIAGSVTNNSDCNDAQKFFQDNDGDGFGSTICVPCGGATNNADCDDDNEFAYPKAQENCANDGTDNDCDGEANSDAEAVDSTGYFVDGDADGFGAGAETKSCTAIAGSVTNDADCDDTKLLYADNDGDTFGAGAPVACGVVTNTDCNDASNAVYPGALENCANDGTDNDCDGEANSDAEAVDSVDYYVDADSDTFGFGSATKSCTAIAGSVTNNADCDDTKLLYADNDADTFGAGAPVACGVVTNTDCNDASNAVYPGALENCANDGTDNDCDGEANSDAEAVDSVGYFVDGDQDGFGAGAETKSCTAIAGSVTNNADCDDTKLLYADNDADTFGAGAPVACGVVTNTDCNDASNAVYPGAVENCANDGTDNDCDGEANSDAEAVDSVNYYVDADRDTFGAGTATKSCTPIAGSVTNNADCDDTKLLYADNDADTFGAGAPVACGVVTNTDCNDASNAVYPGAVENCANDGTDNDCDGEADSDAEAVDSVSYYVDADSDTFGAGTATKSCTAIAGSVTNNADCDDTKLLYADNDGDTFGAGAPVACGVVTNTDCNDASNAVYPGALENCANDGTDNDCDGEANSDAEAVDSVNYYVDADRDTFGFGSATKSCTAIAGSVTNNADCDDTKLLYADNDGDTFGAGNPVACGVASNSDCNDASNAVYPGALENCANDGTDNDCDGEANSDAEAVDSVNYYVDADRDTFGAGTATKSCTPIAGSVTNNADCDDTKLLYADNDADTFGAGNPVACGVASNSDCNDASNAVYPGALENCANDGTDNDCDGEANSDAEAVDSVNYYVDADRDTFGAGTATKSCTPIAGSVTNNADCDDTKLLYADNDADTFGAGNPVACGVASNTDCNDASNAVYPGAVENCANDGTDNDCDGEANSDLESVDARPYYADNDGDTFGAGTGVRSCTPITGRVLDNTDCDDTKLLYTDADGDNYGAGNPVACGVALNGDCADNDPTRFPSAIERCSNDGVDNDCDGEADSDAEAIDSVNYYVDADSDSFGAGTATKSCTPIAGSVTNNTDCDDTKLLYTDADGDNYGAGAPVACGVALNGDCADNDPTRFPGAIERCANDGVDNDCDGEADSDAEAIDAANYYVDADSDSFGAGAATKSCTPIAGSETNNADCNDNQLQYTDADGDNYGAGAPVACGIALNGDCADNDPARFPGAIERCSNDGIDNDCDGEANSDAEAIDSVDYFVDADSDSYGAGSATKSCTPVAGSVTNSADCNDAAATIYPGAPEQCNDIDDNCNLVVDDGITTQDWYPDADGDGYGNASAPAVADCRAPAGHVPNNLDCNDADSAIKPGALENCANDGTDNDCDGEANSDAEAVDSTSYYVDADRDTFGAGTATKSCTAIAGSVTNNADCDDTQKFFQDNDGDGFGSTICVPCGGSTNNADCNDANGSVYPKAPENCANDGTDNDCDGEANSDAEATDSLGYFIDGDADGYGAGTETKSCTAIAGSVTNGTDCNDKDASTYPGASELCANLGTDNDCDGVNTDEEATDRSTFYRDADGDTFTGSETARFCTAPAGYEPTNEGDCNDASNAVYPGAIENCANDGTDNDCDGEANSDLESVDARPYYADNDGDTFGAGTGVRSCTPIPDRVPDNTDCDDTKLLYADIDGDNYGAGSPAACGVALNGDCADNDATRFPGAIERCSNDGVDNDCDGEADSDAEAIDSVDYFVDGDADGFGAGTATKSCSQIAGSVTNNTDCDDTKLLYTDADGDNYGAGAPVACGVALNGDCADDDSSRYPGAIERCSNDGVDNDCDGEANSDAEAIDSVNYYVDADSDSFGAGAATKSCTPIAGSVTNNADCDDTKRLYADTDGDNYGAGAPIACGGVLTNTDCAPNDPTRFPGAIERCSNDGVDNDCDGEANSDDEAIDSVSYYVDADSDSFGAGAPTKSCTPIAGSVTNNADCDDARLLYVDNDGDTYGSGAPVACGAARNDDCNDGNPAINPGAAEVCNGIDDNCVGGADDGLPVEQYYPDVDGDGFGAGDPVNACAAPAGYVLGRGDGCPNDPAKQAAGVCGCGVPDADGNGNGVIDCKDVELFMVPMTTGVVPGQEYRVRVSAMSPSTLIALTGMQLAVKFDASRLEMIDVQPVEGTPLSFEIAQNINNNGSVGSLRYAIGVDAGQPGLTGPADLVDLVFTVLDDADVCDQDVQLAWFENVGTFRTVLVTPPPAVSVFPTLSSLLPIDLDITDPVIAGVPESVAIPADAGSAFGAFVAAPTVTATDNCTDPIVLDLVVNYPDASGLPDATAWPLDGMFPVGTTSLRWSSVDETGNMSEAIRTITVHDYALADISITLEGLQRAASTRSIRVTAEGGVDFNDVAFNAGVGAVVSTFEVPVSATLSCIEVKDALELNGNGSVRRHSHSMTSTTAATIVGTRYSGSVTLLQGDSNDDDKVDIADFTLFVSDKSTPGNPSRAPDARSNFDGNAFVNTADFSYISTNFFKRGQTCTPGAADDAPLGRISVKELRRQGLGHLDGADLNRDGWVDMRDMQIFMQGGPVTGSPSAPEGSVDSGW